ncbi:MAG TPA: hypothetical protein VJC39_05155 [Candidatus Nanoarchaeia archaeon]|nr:hypothetical protein [Candidatus Nanoarchaeia archaeon]
MSNKTIYVSKEIIKTTANEGYVLFVYETIGSGGKNISQTTTYIPNLEYNQLFACILDLKKKHPSINLESGLPPNLNGDDFYRYKYGGLDPYTLDQLINAQ